MAIRKIVSRSVNSSYTNALTTNTEFLGTEAIRLPVGTSAQRAGEKVGDLRYNTDVGVMEQYTVDGWTSVAAFPVINNISPTSIAETSSSVNITINGSSFSSNITVVAIGQNSSTISATSVSRVSANQLVATFNGTQFSDAQEDYSIKVTNSTGLSSTLSGCLAVNQTPAFTTANNALLVSVNNGAAISTSIAATDDEGATLTFSSSNTPAWLTLNSNGTITGTAPYPVSQTDYSFTATVSDGVNTSTTRTFRIGVSGHADSNASFYAPFTSNLTDAIQGLNPTANNGSVSVATVGGYSAASFGSGGIVYGSAAGTGWDGVQNFTMEAWVYFTGGGDSMMPIMEFGSDAVQTGMGYQAGILWRNGTSNNDTNYWRGTAANLGATVTKNTWFHYALVGQGNTLRAYVNGVQTGTYDKSANPGFNGNPEDLWIGQSEHSTTQYMTGGIRMLRMSKTVRYPNGTSFTPSTVYPIA